MSILRKPYEISLWDDVWNSANNCFEERRIATIGSSEMQSQFRALEPSLVRKTNGEVSFSFKMYYQFIDNITGENQLNPFTSLIKNESKIKLYYNGEWFDFLVKSVAEDSSKKSCTYKLVDQHVTELSKNGYNVELDSKLMNNLGTAKKLGEKILEDTNWLVESEKIIQTQEEALVMLKLPANLDGYNIYKINDLDLENNGAVYSAITDQERFTMREGEIYAFYSSCSGDKPYRFQFIYKKESGKYDTFVTQSDRVITEKQCQYFIDGISDWVEYDGFTIPQNFSISPRESNSVEFNNTSAISAKYRGRRYVYNQIREYHPGLDMYLEKCHGTVFVASYTREPTEQQWSSWSVVGSSRSWRYYEDGSKPSITFPIGSIVNIISKDFPSIYVAVTVELKQSSTAGNPWVFEGTTIPAAEYYKYTKTNYITPNLIQNIVTNDKFNGVSGWTGTKFVSPWQIDNNEAAEIPVTQVQFTESISQYRANNYSQFQWDFYAQPGRVEDWTGARDLYNSQLYPYLCISGKTKNNQTVHIIGKNLGGVESGTDTDGSKTYTLNVRTIASQNGGPAPTSLKAIMSSPAYNPILSAVTGKIEGTTLTTGIGAMLQGDTPIGEEYIPLLRCGNLGQEKNTTSIDRGSMDLSGFALEKTITNSGFSDMAKLFPDGVIKGEKYHLEFECFKAKENLDSDVERQIYELSTAGTLPVRIRVASLKINAKNNGYDYNDYFSSIDKVLFECYKTLEITQNGSSFNELLEAQLTLSSQELAEGKYYIFIEFPEFVRNQEITGATNFTIKKYFVFIKKLSIYKHYERTPKSGDSDQRPYYTPETAINVDNTGYNIEEKYFPVFHNDTRKLKDISFSEFGGAIYIPALSPNAERESMVNIKESNYFNGIHSIAETFECWPKIEVIHDANGQITEKTIKFKNYVGQPSYTGFRYGLNLKNISRTIDSQQIVSKLIVKSNSNEYAKNGFCSIARAPANTIKDNVLYDFGYYINQGMIDATTLSKDLHLPILEEEHSLKEGLNKEEKIYDTYTYLPSSAGYYSKARIINQRLENLANLISEKSTPLSQATAEYNTYKAMYDAAGPELVEAQNSFHKVAGFAYNNLPTDQNELDKIFNSTVLYGYLTKIAELASKQDEAKKRYEAAEQTKKGLQNSLDIIEIQYDNAILFKKELNKLFYAKYSRYIQEGTWIDESYTDDSLYYNDAMSVLYNSSMPKISYSIGVISLAGVPEYELIDYKIGDQTFVEDVEFFGYESDGITPFREKITVTETTENLDNPTKNSIKVQNYENQFQDLFQRITATVQSVQYAEGSQKKASALVEADAAHKIKFLQGALKDADTALTNSGSQEWVLDASGLTLESSVTHDRLRAVGGAILFGKQDENGDYIWVTGITNEGISANLITAGTVNTGVINIMNGDDPTFRWDSHGITAYYFDNETNSSYIAADNTKGVRFDRFGVYGYEGINGEFWKPTGLNEGPDSIEAHSNFYLTWEGLKIREGETVLRIGKNAKDQSILSVTNNGQTTFNIDSNGTVTMGKVEGFVTSEDLKNYVPMSSGGSFVWNFDPDSGVTMGDGNNCVLQIGKEGNEYKLIMQGKITAKEGQIGKFFINTNGLYEQIGEGTNSIYSGIHANASGTSNKVFYAGARTKTGSQAEFYVQSDGYLYAEDAEIVGKITASEGSIGAWNISTDGLLYTRDIINGIYYGAGLDVRSDAWSNATGADDFTVFAIGKNFGNDGNIAAWSQCPLRVTRAGKLYATNADISGKITATEGFIGNFSLLNGKLYTNNKSSIDDITIGGVYIGSDGINIGAGSAVSGSPYVKLEASSGKLSANKAYIEGEIKATKGYIGSDTTGWNIDESGMTSASQQIGLEYAVSERDSSGNITVYGIWRVDSTIQFTPTKFIFKPKFSRIGSHVVSSGGLIIDAHPSVDAMKESYGLDGEDKIEILWSKFIKKMK